MRLVEWSFQKRNTTFYSSIVAKKGFNLLMAIALNDSFKLALIDIRAALLPAKSLEGYFVPYQILRIWNQTHRPKKDREYQSKPA